ncbi:MAG: zinc ribbon domain-containing protein [Candidatus Thorarchaeota archaeon]
MVVTMEGHIVCPECGTGLRSGSTFCLKCGHKMEEVAEHATVDSVEPGILPQPETLEEPIEWGELDEQMSELNKSKEPASVEDGLDTLPSLDESELPEIVESQTKAIEPAVEPAMSTHNEELSWEADESLIEAEATPPTTEDVVSEIPEDTFKVEEDDADLSWDDSTIKSEEIKEGMPFVEIEPPRVLTEAPMGETEAALAHLFPESMDASTIDAVQHLFPEGRRTTGKDFVNRVVGKPTRIGVATPMPELDTAECAGCGGIATSDEFDYPGYVYEAMGKARVEAGDAKLKEIEHETAIEYYEMAKRLFERAGNIKMVEECEKRVDYGYDQMAETHYSQGENHLKAQVQEGS